jgi:hypothetical protein
VGQLHRYLKTSGATSDKKAIPSPIAIRLEVFLDSAPLPFQARNPGSLVPDGHYLRVVRMKIILVLFPFLAGVLGAIINAGENCHADNCLRAVAGSDPRHDITSRRELCSSWMSATRTYESRYATFSTPCYASVYTNVYQERKFNCSGQACDQRREWNSHSRS